MDPGLSILMIEKMTMSYGIYFKAAWASVPGESYIRMTSCQYDMCTSNIQGFQHRDTSCRDLLHSQLALCVRPGKLEALTLELCTW